MGFLGFGKQRRGGRAADFGETMAGRKSRLLARLEKTNPDLYEQIVLAQLFPDAKVDRPRPPSLLDGAEDLLQLMKVMDKLKGKDDDTMEIVKALAPAVLPGLMGKLGLAPPSAPAPTPAPQLTSPEPAAGPAEGEASMGFAATFIVNTLQSKPVPACAAWICERNDQFAQDLVGLIRRTPDNEVIAALNSLPERLPERYRVDTREVVNWLLALPRREWLMALVREIKALGQANQAVTGL